MEQGVEFSGRKNTAIDGSRWDPATSAGESRAWLPRRDPDTLVAGAASGGLWLLDAASQDMEVDR